MAFLFEDEDFEKLVRVKEALYREYPIDADRKRDLANALDAILRDAEYYSEEFIT